MTGQVVVELTRTATVAVWEVSLDVSTPACEYTLEATTNDGPSCWIL